MPLPVDWPKFRKYLIYDAGRDPKHDRFHERWYNLLERAFASRDFTRDTIHDFLDELYSLKKESP